MRVPPVSFKSLMVFTLPSNKPKLEVPQLMELSFKHSQALKGYSLGSLVHYDKEKVDGTVHNAYADFAEKLDNEYESQLPRGSKKVMFTEADFYVKNPRETEKRYFLTAATKEDEDKLHKILSKSSAYYTVKYRTKMQ